MIPTSVDGPFVISQGDLATQHAEAVLDSAVIARADVSVIDLRGPRAVECAQGITTNDVAGAGDGSFIYGAILTPKGMIISDLWSVRDNDTVSLIIPAPATESVSSVLRKSIPPRLARINDLSDETVVFRLVGPRALEVASSAGFHIPDSGHTVWCVVDSSKCLVNRPTDPAPFALQLNVPVHDAAQVSKHLQQSGAEPGPDTALELARILAGWPRLGSEIGEKTLPQEVRFDDINGVSYTKGCYTGQETVARLHFRGHANRGLVGIAWDDQPELEVESIIQGDSEIGRVTSIVWLDPIDKYIGMGMVRLTSDLSQPVVASNAEASLLELPFRFDS